ncbi:MAG: hydroxyacylglutathione hydrolase [Alphaproteobacteria bacterium]|nr:MAG: hydroxyacylglutathione hydrolase [Alphaproteobacteria bacterium]
MGRSPLQVHQFPCLSDNYGYLVHDPVSGETAVIDTPDVAPILKALDETGWQLTYILNTHHHFDHAGGNQKIKEKTGCKVIGPKNEAAKIPGLDRAVGDGDTVALGSQRAMVFDVPGHTAGHIAYWFEEAGIAFVGDTLFALGCGRIFEGTPEQMWSSLQKLMTMPDDTIVYCAHEYTQSNAAFALSVEPQNEALVSRSRQIDELRAAGKPTVPSTMALEKATNPFLRPTSKDLQANINKLGAPIVEVFAETRRLKDNF